MADSNLDPDGQEDSLLQRHRVHKGVADDGEGCELTWPLCGLAVARMRMTPHATSTHSLSTATGHMTRWAGNGAASQRPSI